MGIPSRFQKISQWHKYSTYLKNWCPNKIRSMEWKQFVGKIIHGSICLWLVMNRSSVFSAQRSTSFQILYCVLERYTRIPSRTSPEYRTLDRIDGETMEFEWNIFPRFNTLQLDDEVKDLLLRLNETPENFTGRIKFMLMFNDISWRSRDNEKECESNARLVSLYARRFGTGQWSFLGPGSERKLYSISEDSRQGEWDKMAEMMLTFAESGHSIFRATSPLSRGQLKSKGGWRFSIHFCADEGTIETAHLLL